MMIWVFVIVSGLLAVSLVVAAVIIIRQKGEYDRLSEEARFLEYKNKRENEFSKLAIEALKAELREQRNQNIKLKGDNKRLRDACLKSDEMRQKLIEERDHGR